MIDVDDPGADVRDGRAASLAALYTEQRPRLVRLAAVILGSTMTADDIVQDAFTKLHRQIATVREPAAWLHTVVVRACANEKRHLGVKRRTAPRLVDPIDLGDHRLDETLRVVRQLPARQRTAVVLRYYADHSEAQIAEAMGVSLGTVKSTLSRALDRLRELLAKEES